MVSYPGYPGLSERGTLMGGGGPVPCLLVLLVAVSYIWQHVYSRWMSFEMDASAIKSLMPGTYTTEEH